MSRHVINGVIVDFPYEKAYDQQMAVMKTVIGALDVGENCLVESPTGTGKSLSLLCAALAWQSRRGAGTKIFYTSRTHKQLSQVVAEFGRTVYARSVVMTMLASRDYGCIHPAISRQPYLKNEACNALIKTHDGCRFAHPEALAEAYGGRRRELGDAWDIEDVVAYGKRRGTCPYFGARTMMKEAGVVFCPYNYVIDPAIRRSIDLDLTGHALIVDEAHNAEDCARDAVGSRFEIRSLETSVTELDVIAQLHPDRSSDAAALGSFVSDLAKRARIVSRSSTTVTWSGAEIARDLMDGFDETRLNALRDRYRTVETIRRSCVDVVGELLKTFDWILSSPSDFRASIGPSSIDFRCMNPAVAFRPLADIARCVVLASGTLSPMDSFETELGVAFPRRLVNSHVVPPENVWVGLVANGPTGTDLRGDYASSSSVSYQDEVGRCLASVCETVPGGILCFFSSYANAGRMTERWRRVGLWSRVERFKTIVTEDRNGGADSIRRYRRAVAENPKGGAIYLAVFRGKASEGLDFKDDDARAVVSVGIPFPNYADEAIKLKRAFNDARVPSSGKRWYDSQAYRAVNQALGRCLRHRYDWGALVLLDSRFVRETVPSASLSGWIADEARSFSDWSVATESLKAFVSTKKK